MTGGIWCYSPGTKPFVYIISKEKV